MRRYPARSCPAHPGPRTGSDSRHAAPLRSATSSSSKSGVSTSSVAADHAQELGLDVGFVYRNALHGYSALVPPARARRAEGRPARRLRRARLDRPRRHDADRRDVGNRPDRPARSAAQRHLHLHGDRRRVTAYVIDTGIRKTHTRVRRPRRPRRRHDDSDRRHLRRLPRPRHACRRHDRRLDLRRREERPPRRRARAHLRRHGTQLGRDRRRRLGDRAITRPASLRSRT